MREAGRGGAVGAILALMVGGCHETTVVPNGHSILVASDIHVHAPSLGNTGPAFDAFAQREGRLIRESTDLLAELRRKVESQHPALLLLSGDLTSNGELASHQLVAGELAAIRAAGTAVLVVPGNHDVSNPRAASWTDSGPTPAPSVGPEEFVQLYGAFGYASALARDQESLSYVAEPLAGLRVLALDSTAAGRGGASGIDSGRLADSTLVWAKQQIAAAKVAGVQIIGLMHHQLLEHFRDQAAQYPGYVIDGGERLRSELASAGLRLILTGHFHATDIARAGGGQPGSFIFDVSTGSTVSYPCAYRTLDIKAADVLIRTGTLMPSILTGGKVFPVYAHDQLEASIQSRAISLLQAPPYELPASTAADLALWGSDALIAHQTGDESIPPDTYAALRATVLTGDAAQRQAAAVLMNLWTDTAPNDREILLNLETGTWF